MSKPEVELAHVDNMLASAMLDAEADAIREEETQPYHLEPDDQHACKHCNHGRLWMVVGPGDIAESTMYDDEENAQDMADDLNDAYAKGFAAGKEEP